MNFKNLFLLPFFFLVYMQTAKAQSAATFDASQVVSTFKFMDGNGSAGNNYTSSIGSSYNLGYLHVSRKGLMVGINIGSRMAGASENTPGTSYVWSFHYAEAKLGIGYMLNCWRLRPFVLLSPYYASLIQATQTVNEVSYDIKKDNAVTSSDYGVIATGGLNVKLSDFISIYSCYNQIYGIKNIQTTANEQLYNRGFSVSLGVALTITKTAPKWIQQ